MKSYAQFVEVLPEREDTRTIIGGPGEAAAGVHWVHFSSHALERCVHNRRKDKKKVTEVNR